MESSVFRPMTWPVLRALSRNPLVRASDRIEAAMTTLAVLAVLAGAVCAGALGTMVHDVRARMYIEEAQSRHPVMATAVEDSKPMVTPQSVTFMVHARWQSNGARHTDDLSWDKAVKAATPLQIWVDSDGNRVNAPSAVSRAGIDAVGIGVAMWLTVALAVVGIARTVRCRIGRMRDAQWEQEIQCLVGDDGGHTNRSQ